MSSQRLRWYLIGVLALAAVVSVIAKKTDSPFVGWISFALFLGALAVYVQWRRTTIAERRARRTDERAP